ncbi:hypothetical protein BGZ49_010463 [Haplosporangium sp. Z 27]|nr:hypothetical protein BGZ49_010463 [Haplosporangium sp. Z 27]
MRHVYKHDALAWEKTLAFAMIEVYWRQRQTVFIEQIEKAKSRPSPTHVVDFLGPFTSDAEVLAHTMINSLCLTNYHNRALRLYEALSDHGIRMPSRFIDNFIRFAVSLGDGYQLEAIGNMMLRQEKLYRQSMLSDSPEMQLKNRLSIIAARSMDSFVYGACENGLNELARAVFNQGLEANQKYRLSTFDGILNSYSISEFGFDIVEAANAGLKKVKKSRRPKDTDRPTVYDTSFVTRSIPKAITVADPKDIEKYISAMETLGIKPNIVTLNIIVKLYLEMAQHKVKDAPSWESAFTRYNPLGLKPDLVTNNTLLAFYEKQKDLTTMKLIYDDMAGTPDRRLPDNSKRARKLQRKLEAEQDRFFDRDTLNPDKTNEFVYSDDNAPLEREESREIQSRNDRYSPARYVRSNRDIFTYNTMIHALLQHAVDSKDIDSIGQCFHDMELDGIKPDTVTFNTNILYHISRGDYTAAMQVFRSMDSKRIRTKKMTTDASDSWAFGNMSSTSTPANSISGASEPIRSTPSMESSLLRSARTRELGAQIQNDLDQKSINTKGPAATSPPVPDIISFTSLISGFGQSDNLDKATEMFMEMTKRFKIEPNLKTYSALAAGLNRAGDHERAERLWNEVIGADQDNSMKTRSGFSHDSGYRRQLIQIYKSMLQNEELMLGDDEKAERLRYKLLIMGETSGVLTFKERRQFEARRKMYRDSMKE